MIENCEQGGAGGVPLANIPEKAFRTMTREDMERRMIEMFAELQHLKAIGHGENGHDSPDPRVWDYEQMYRRLHESLQHNIFLVLKDAETRCVKEIVEHVYNLFRMHLPKSRRKPQLSDRAKELKKSTLILKSKPKKRSKRRGRR